MAQNMKRGRNQRRRSGSNVNRALDSNGPDVKIRGTALQIYDKYQALARDAASSGDRIRAESLLQHAEHYYRMLKSMQPAQSQQQNQNQQQNDPADEPQPDMNKASAEGTQEAPVIDASGEEGSSSETKSEEAEKPRRTRRRRPARKNADSSANSNDQDASSDQEVAAAE